MPNAIAYTSTLDLDIDLVTVTSPDPVNVWTVLLAILRSTAVCLFGPAARESVLHGATDLIASARPAVFATNARLNTRASVRQLIPGIAQASCG